MLTDAGIRRLQAREKRYQEQDGAGLSLEVMTTGEKFWRMRVVVKGKEYRRSLGKYPIVGLKDARAMRDEIRRKITVGENPFEETSGRTFESVAREWVKVKVAPIRKPQHIKATVSRLERLVLPRIGAKSIRAVSPVDLLTIAREIEEQGSQELAHRIVQICGQIFRYGIAIGQAERDVSADLRGALMPVKTSHHPTITDPAEVGALMRAIDDLNGSPVVRCALMFQAYTFVRPGELRKAEWEEIDLEREEWKIPPEKMKIPRLHIVPLSRQAIAVLRELTLHTGDCRWLFPAIRTKDRPMSDMTANAAIRRMGYGKDEFTGHGFRSMASTILNEHQWNRDWIERQLAHTESDSIRAAYNHAEYLPERKKMMQWWADWLDAQK